jgi:hypothetical protein
MSVSLTLNLWGHWVMLGICPFSWLVFKQGGKDLIPLNLALGPLRLTLN